MAGINAYSRTHSSIYRGIIESNDDPKGLGRCRIRVPSVHGELNYPIENLPWARPITAHSVSKGRGSVSIPSVGDVVWVFFEGSQKEFPVYLGGTYGAGEISVDTGRVDIYTEDGNSISYDRKGKSCIIKVGESFITVSESGISIKGDTSLDGDLEVKGNLSVSGHTTLGSLTVTGAAHFQGSVTGIPKE